MTISTRALGSLEACELLAEGLRTNPAAAPDAARLLQPYLDAARDSHEPLACGHTVDRSGTTHSFRLCHGKQVANGVGWLVISALCLTMPVLSLFAPTGLGVGTAIGVFGVGLACLWEGIRSFRIEAQVSGQKLTIRNELRTYTVDFGDIRASTLQPHTNGQHRTSHWIARAELTDEKSSGLTVSTAARRAARQDPIWKRPSTNSGRSWEQRRETSSRQSS